MVERPVFERGIDVWVVRRDAVVVVVRGTMVVEGEMACDWTELSDCDVATATFDGITNAASKAAVRDTDLNGTELTLVPHGYQRTLKYDEFHAVEKTG